MYVYVYTFISMHLTPIPLTFNPHLPYSLFTVKIKHMHCFTPHPSGLNPLPKAIEWLCDGCCEVSKGVCIHINVYVRMYIYMYTYI
jgi:hypothetical protein